MHFREFVCYVCYLFFRFAALPNNFTEVGKRFDIKNWTNIGQEEMVEPYGLIDIQRLEKRFIEERYWAHVRV